MNSTLLEFKSFTQMIIALPDDDSCREYLEQIRWEGKPTCPHCADQEHYRLKVKGEFKGLYKCRSCRNRYTVTVGTVFEGTHISLRKWFIAIYLFGVHKKGISSYQLADDLGITQKSAWYMLSRIRYMYDVESEMSSSPAYCDETFVGGKNKNRHKDKKVVRCHGRSFRDKTPVFGIIQDGKIRTRVIPDTKKETLVPLVLELLPEGSMLITDEWQGYRSLSGSYNHVTVNHAGKQYVSEDGYSTNNVENFWSHLKRGIIGVYHNVSPKHLQKYCDEFAFRFNNRVSGPSEKFNLSLILTSKGRLRYKQLIQNRVI